jgi:hypothetical protein
MVFSARTMQMAAQAMMEHVMPTLSNNCTATEERCFLCGLCQVVISETVSEKLVKSWLAS